MIKQLNNTIYRFFELYKIEPEERINRATAIRITLFTCFAGLIYSLIYVFGLSLDHVSDVVHVYILLSVTNLLVYYFNKKYDLFRKVQLLLIILLPIACQLFIGGFIASSAVGISAILAPIGALLFYNVRVARILMVLFVLLLCGAGFVEYYFLEKISHVPLKVEIMFFVLILGTTSIIIYSLLEYIISEKQKIAEELKALNFDLTISKLEIEKKNAVLLAQRNEIQTQQSVLEVQIDIIQKNNDEIKASIRYASSIQSALLPGNLKLDEYFKDSFFTYYKPRDIVSGDFYWCEKVGEKIILVTADCTGHGVPGAFMSMLGVSGLNSIVFQKGITSSDEILNQLHDFIFKSLSQEKGMSADGMDIGVVVFDSTLKHIEFSGAMNPLYYIKNGEFFEIKGDKKPIGGLHYGYSRSYSKINIDLQGVEMIYLASDGYQDQFGGKDNMKFMKKRFKGELQRVCGMPIHLQKEQLDNSIKEWMLEGSEKQIDDILVMGIKVA